MKKSRAAVLLALAVIFIFGRSDSVRAEDLQILLYLQDLQMKMNLLMMFMREAR